MEAKTPKKLMKSDIGLGEPQQGLDRQNETRLLTCQTLGEGFLWERQEGSSAGESGGWTWVYLGKAASMGLLAEKMTHQATILWLRSFLKPEIQT